MLGKRPRPMIGKISELLISGNRTGYFDVIKSPRSPLDLIQSPKGLKNYDLGGVGLGILAALEKSGNGNGEILAKCAIFSPNSSRSSPIPVNSGRKYDEKNFENCDMESLENYTYVTCRGPNNKSITKIYYDGCNINYTDDRKNSPVNGIPVYPTSDFLSSCHSCRKKLDGKDIFIYRGEKGFCSAECRSKQILIDERKEQQCKIEAARSVEISNSPYSREHIFSTGILAI